MSDMGIFEGYMEVEYNEGKEAKKNNLKASDCPYDKNSEAGKAWVDGFEENCLSMLV